jgi:dTDP-4-amino-4,6-dideoxygalactose transaminase
MKIPMSKPFESPEIEKAVIDVIRSGRHVGGKEVESFERKFADYIGTEHAVAVNSATSAEMLALVSLDVKPGDEVIVPSHTMFATVEPIFHVGAKPVFVDVDETFTICPDDLRDKITDRCVGVIPVHLYGHCANMNEITRIAEENNLWVVEDCAQAHGSKCADEKVGTFGVAGVFSFFPSKNLGTIGDGGLVVTDDEHLAEMVRKLRNHGRTERYTHEYVGYNLRFDPVKAAVCRTKLRFLDEFNQQRRANARYYDELLKDLDLSVPTEANWCYHVYHLYVIMLKDKNTRDNLTAYLRKKDIETNIHFPISCHLQPATVTRIGRCESLPKTENIADRILSLPMYPGLEKNEIEYVRVQLGSFFESTNHIGGK